MTLHRTLSSALLLAAAIGFARPALAEDEAKLKASAQLYDTYCAQCHGVNRNGKGVNTIGLSVQPRDHSDTAGMSTLPATQMFTAIKGGGAAVNKSALMPAWGSVLTDDEINDMVEYLRHVCKCGAAK
jgi:cytochrome c oxidase cbb3-type subunit 3